MKEVRKKQTRFTVAVGIALVAAALSGVLLAWEDAPLIGWDAGAAALLFMLWRDFASHDAERTAAIASRDDMDHSTIDVLLIAASVISIAAVAILLTNSAHTNNTASLLSIGFGLLSIVISWAVVHSVYTLRYAVMYYRRRSSGVDFNDATLPRFSDFAYLAFTIGMTYQVSDTNFKNSEFRSVAIRHAMLSFAFGTVIIATTINFIASLAH